MNLLKDAFLGGLSFLGLPEDRAVILMYHSVGPDNGYFWNVRLSDFETQMAHLAQRKISVIPLSELVRRLRAREALGGAVSITFDDGYRDNLTNALPVLKQFGFPATIFVETDSIGMKDKRGFQRLSVEEIKNMVSDGVDIQPHSKSHPKLATLSREVATEEIVGSKERIETLLGGKTSIFAYPYGNHSDETDRIVRDAGFIASTTVHEGCVHRDTDPYRLPRVSIDSSTSSAQFRGKITRAVDVYEALKGIVRV